MKNKIAIFVCGAGGSGKSTFTKTHLNDFINIDVDIIYEDLLISNKLGLKIKDFNKNECILAANFFEKSKKLNDIKYEESIKTGKNIVINTIGMDSNIILFQRKHLENLGYTTHMIILYADLEVCIDRVERRERVYNQSIIKDSWYRCYNNIGTYKKEFDNKFKFVYDINNFILDDFIKLKHNINLI